MIIISVFISTKVGIGCFLTFSVCNNNNRSSIASYGRNFRGAGFRSDQCSVKAWLNRKKVLSLDLKTDKESLMRTVNRLWQRVPDRRCWKPEWTLHKCKRDCLGGSGDWDTVRTDRDSPSEEPGFNSPGRPVDFVFGFQHWRTLWG